MVVASMVGTGIFTTSGFLARDLGSPWQILLLWTAGGFVALCGAMAYAELGAAMPESGGEYVYLRAAYGPLVAWLSGWTSFVAGFSGALAAALLAFAAYLNRALSSSAAPLLDPRAVAVATLWALTLTHLAGVRPGGRVQRSLTLATLAAVAVGVAAGLLSGRGSAAHFLVSSPPQGNVAVSLIFVLYAYSGWNAAGYLAGEIRKPERGIPAALLSGTVLVTALYLAINCVYLYALPVTRMAGVLEIGEESARALFGDGAGRFVAAATALAILSSASAMVLAGPRVYYKMAADGALPRALAHVSRRQGAPSAAILAQSLWATVLVLFFGAFEPLVVYTGFAVTVFAALTVAAVPVLRWRRPALTRPFRMPGYPWLVMAQVATSVWVVAYTVGRRPGEGLAGLLAVGVGVPIYYASLLYARRSRPLGSE